jgi:hypothetical protein
MYDVGMIPNENADNLFQGNRPTGSEFGNSKPVILKAYLFPLRQDNRL